jgi:hypothetical protein
MADRVSVLAVTLVGDEKRRLGERRISAMGRFLLPSLKADRNCVGGSGGHPSAFAQGRFSRKAREMAHRQLFRSMPKKQTRYTSPLKWLTRLKASLTKSLGRTVPQLQLSDGPCKLRVEMS